METEVIQTLETVTVNINTVIAVVCAVYVTFNLYFLLEKFKIKDW